GRGFGVKASRDWGLCPRRAGATVTPDLAPPVPGRRARGARRRPPLGEVRGLTGSFLGLVRARSSASEREAHRGLEPRFDDLVDDADDAVELDGVEMLERDPAGEVQVAVGPDGEPRAVEAVVALEQEPVEAELVPR